MSSILIQQYLNQLATLRKVSGSSREGVVSEAFKDLLKGWARSHDLVFVPQFEITTPAKDRRYVDGALLYSLRVPFGYWEAKDEQDDLDAEIEYKFKCGYPQDNIIFEDSTEAVLIQNKREVIRCAIDNVEQLEKLLNLFFSYERSEIAEFRKAVEQFKSDIPAVLDGLREMIEVAHTSNPGFSEAEQLSKAWEYKLGNRSALEWILDQYNEKKPKDPTIREKFNTYRFADYKEKVIDLLMRVTTVSVGTMEVVGEMKQSAK